MKIESYLTNKLAFDINKLFKGRAVILIHPVHEPGRVPRHQYGLIKNISDSYIELILGNMTSDFEERELPVEAFDGIGCYKLKILS
ncbi:hypothetical protein CHH83_01915 [Bacillus sp. 7586-K]|nr:hypothetical protein CHH83_01915 [Bacillus sp. 7586-K]